MIPDLQSPLSVGALGEDAVAGGRAMWASNLLCPPMMSEDTDIPLGEAFTREGPDHIARGRLIAVGDS